MAKTCTGIENGPKLQRAWGKGCRRQRLRNTQDVETIYEDNNDAVPRDMIALKATDEPIFINDSNDTIMRLVKSAFSGTLNRGLTLDRNLENGSPSSRAKA